MYRLGNVYFVSYEEFNKKEDYSLGLVIAGVAVASMMSIGMYALPVKDAGGLEKAVLRLYVKQDKDSIDFSPKII